MSSSSRVFGENDHSKVELPVFVTPNELVFSTAKRRGYLTVFNPYGSEAHFKILTTNPDRFDVSITKGIIKPNRRIDITIRLVSHEIDELPEATDEPQLIDHFRISIQVASLKGNKQVKVHWCALVDYSENDDDNRVIQSMNADEKAQKVKLKSLKQPLLSSSSASPNTPGSSANVSQRNLSQQSRTSILRSSRSQNDHPANNGSNINLICFLCAIICIISLFLPLAIDSELCKKAKLYSDNSNAQPMGWLAQLSNFLSVSYEMKFGCSFALGLFTYRLISTMPD